jgi:DNA-binding NarL/FixJ family response regulator
MSTAPSAASVRRTSVYLAEDHVALRQMFRAHLEMQGAFRVVGESADGVTTVQECLALRPDLLVLDLRLNGADGLEVLRQLKAAGSATRVLVFSSHQEPMIVRQVVEAGAAGMIEKTAPAETLLRGVVAVAAGKPFFGEAVSAALQQSLQHHAAPVGATTLTAREREVLQLVAAGLANKEVGHRLGISVKTAENHRHRLMVKLGARNAADLTRVAFELGLVITEDRRG